MRMPLKTLLGAAAISIATQAAAEVTFYEGDAFRGRAFTVDGVVDNFAPTGFNDRARSAVVTGGAWQVCEHAQFQGRCVVLGPGNYESLSGLGMSGRISSARPADGSTRIDAPAPLAGPAYEQPTPARAAVSGQCDLGARGGGPAGAALLGRAPTGL